MDILIRIKRLILAWKAVFYVFSTSQRAKRIS